MWEKLKATGKPILLYGMGDGAEKIAAELHAEGFEFVTVHELYSIYGKTLEPGKVYFSPKQ